MKEINLQKLRSAYGGETEEAEYNNDFIEAISHQCHNAKMSTFILHLENILREHLLCTFTLFEKFKQNNIIL